MDSTVPDNTRQALTKAFPSSEMTTLSPATDSRNSPSPAGTRDHTEHPQPFLGPLLPCVHRAAGLVPAACRQPPCPHRTQAPSVLSKPFPAPSTNTASMILCYSCSRNVSWVLAQPAPGRALLCPTWRGVIPPAWMLKVVRGVQGWGSPLCPARMWLLWGFHQHSMLGRCWAQERLGLKRSPARGGDCCLHTSFSPRGCSRTPAPHAGKRCKESPESAGDSIPQLLGYRGSPTALTVSGQGLCQV